MTVLAAEANFKIDQLEIENEGLMNQTADGKSKKQSTLNIHDYFTNPSQKPVQSHISRGRAGTVMKPQTAFN